MLDLASLVGGTGRLVGVGSIGLAAVVVGAAGPGFAALVDSRSSVMIKMLTKFNGLVVTQQKKIKKF